jgi:EmrB/QacA subfamily drug resistance transporter
MPLKWWVLAAVACGTFMATLDASIVNIALPTLTKELGPDLPRVKWVIITYLLVITCLLLPFGRLSDIHGRKKIFQLGFVVFVLGSIFCGFASSLGWLISARVLQAVGASMLMANGPAIITQVFPSTERGRALGTLAMVVSAGLISGPSLGGLLISTFGWRSIFWINIPFGLLGAYLVQKHVVPDSRTRPQIPFDWAGALLQTILLISFIIMFDPPAVSVSGSLPFPVSRWVVALVTLVFGAIFIKVEYDAKAPLFDLGLLRNRTFWTANLASFLMFVASSAVIVLMPFFLEEVLKLPTHTAGAYMTVIPVCVLIVAPVAGRLSDRFGSQELSFLGALIGAAGLFGMAGVFGNGISANVTTAGLIVGLASIGVATGLFQSPNNNAIMGAVPSSKLGVASALLATVRNMGLVTGTGLATTLFSWRLGVTEDFVSSLHLTHLVAGLFAVAAMIAALGKERGPHRGGN